MKTKQMKPRLRLATGLAICVAALISIQWVAGFQVTQPKPTQTKEEATTEKKVEKKRKLPFRGTVGKIDLKAKTFTLINKSNEKSRLFKIQKDTKFENSGKPAKLQDLVKGKEVRGSCYKTGDRVYEAVLVRIGPVPAKKPKNSSEAKKKQ